MKTSLFTLLAVVSMASAHGVIITQPMTLSTQFVVGVHNGELANSNPTTERAAAETILDLALGATFGNFQSNTVFNYSGDITSVGAQVINSTSVPAGWDGVLAKYDGAQGGYILFALGGQATTLPQFPYNFWTTNTGQLGLSHYTPFDADGLVITTQTVPDGGSMLMLLGSALAGIEGMRRLMAKRAFAAA
jgi:VPDSG-CTERM motif